MHASVCDTISDLVQNSIEAGASRVELDVATGPDAITVRVRDNGKGMDKTTLEKVMDPFYSESGKHDHRRVGLGLPLLHQTAEAVNGKVDIRSVPGNGTTVEFTFDARHLDTPPLGDLPATVLGLMAFGGTYDLVLNRTTPADGYSVSRRELTETLGDLEESANLVLARDFLRSQEENLNH
ncbi:MAG TPA: ATP-binding protein [Kiritimatiellia bacterium]|nr:ATP-binding protein [Kiritimatiellia bacterium]HPS08042.1 ATP-binding protein [Kiritimatiellia bacterium]